MPKVSSNSTSNKRQPRSSRSVAGCLTCRRRRVKCTSRVTPCEPCRRLDLSCDPSFHQNFKPWASDDGPGDVSDQDHGKSRTTPKLNDDRGRTRRTAPAATITAPSESNIGTGESRIDAVQEDRASRDMETMNTSSDDSFNLLDFIFSDLANEMTIVDFTTPGNPYAYVNPNWADQRTAAAGSYDMEESDSSGYVMPHSTNTTFSAGATRISAASAMAMASQAIPLDSSTSQAMSRVPEFLSTKQSIYTCFHYIVNSARALPNSPLCYAILSWVYAYLARLSAGQASSRDEHYTAASDGIKCLVAELTSPTAAHDIWKPTNISEQLSSYLSATFFVCQYDLMEGNYCSFITRIGDTKSLFRRLWAERTLPGPVESRILIWLAFLELRFFFLGGERYAADDGQTDLMTLLEETKALSALRRARTKKSTLSDIFPDGLPQEEDEEDLRKERCRLRFDDIMCYLAKLRHFMAWDKLNGQRTNVEAALLNELRDAKVQALHADLRRLQAECELAIPYTKKMPASNETIDSITFHTLTVRTLRSCATIMFRRATDPKSQTGSECQDAVADIVRIARLLRQTKYLRSPRSTIWPLPLYIAGIESADGIYQDWILDYMKELGSWGSHIEEAAHALQQIINLQENTGSTASLMDETRNSHILRQKSIC